MGAWIGCAKDDIKKVLAGSTMSQIGYMMLAAGLGVAGYAFAIFHLLTHGFFKANMFLGAGSVMHGTNDDVDMRHYGALRKLMPVTFLTFAMGYLAIIGFPGFAGFWSKDKIIETALAQNVWLGICALIGAGVTGFYMTRLMLMTFFTKERWEEGVHPHESPKVMTVPLIVLAALSVLGGLLLLNDWIVDVPVAGDRNGPARGAATAGHRDHAARSSPSSRSGSVSPGCCSAGATCRAWRRPGCRCSPPPAATSSTVTPFNDAIIVGPGKRFTHGLAAFDAGVVDGGAMGTASAFGGASGRLRLSQNGFVRSYALSLLGGAALVLLALVVVNLG